MMPQYFKGDPIEINMDAGFAPAPDSTSASLDQFFEGSFTQADFLLALYDGGLVPFVDRVPRDAFVGFYRKAVEIFPFTGTFEFYLFILKGIFGENTDTQFTVTDPGKIEILVDSEASIPNDWIALSFNGVGYDEIDLVTDTGDEISLVELSGIKSEAQLKALFAELTPAGIYMDLTMRVFDVSEWSAVDSLGNFDDIVNEDDDELVFFTLGA